jgi:pimeloyl-ACP methyl ester carboxylesterase
MQWFIRILKWLGVGVLGLLGLGAIYQQIGRMLDSRLAPPASEMVSVNGHAVHLVCTGEGKPTFVLDAGLGAWSFEWFRLQPLLAKTGRVCAFDRPGLGWSESADGGHDGLAAANQLAALVAAAKIHKPFYYVGHSLGANFAQIYYAERPGDIAGLILIEPGDPKDLLEDTTETRAQVMHETDCGAMCYSAGALSYLGLPRIAAQTMIGHKTLSARQRSDYIAGLGHPSDVMTTVAELAAVPKTAYQDLDVKSFGDTPVLTFDSTLPREPEGKETVADVKVWKKGQVAFLASLSAKSTRGAGPVHVPNSSHASMVMGEKQSEFMAKAIDDFVNGINPAR